MRIIGIGNDIVECVRIRRLIDRHGEQFLARVFTGREIGWCQARKHVTEQFAARWAAKESVRKCLQIASARQFDWTEVEVRTDAQGVSSVTVRGAARERAETLGVSEFFLTLAHCRTFATACAIAIVLEPETPA